MKKKMMVLLSSVPLLITVAGALEVEFNAGYVNTSDTCPTAWSPQVIAAKCTDAANRLDGDDRDALETDDDGDIFIWQQPSNKTYNWILLTFLRPEGSINADLHWRTWVDGGANVYVKYWQNGY